MIPVIESSIPPIDEYIKEIQDIWKSKWLTNMGEKHNELNKKLKDYLKVDNIDLLVNGHMALELSIQALGLTKGEVITTPFTFASTTHAIVRNGLKPVFCDIDPWTYTIDVNMIEDLITKETVAILPVHVYGNVCNVENIEEIAKRHNLKVIYDAAHTFGEKYKGIGIGNYGDISCFSFHATKVFNTIEGGAVCFRNKNIGKKIYQLKNFGIMDEENINGIGANAKMNEFCASMGICNLRHIDEEIQKRKIIVDRYRTNLSDIEGLQLAPIQKNVDSNYAYFPVIIDKNLFGQDRNFVKDKLSKEGISTRKYFYPLTSSFECYKGLFGKYETPVAAYISKNVLTLPLYSDLSIEDVDRICCVMLEK